MALKHYISGGILVVLLLLTTFTLQFAFDKDKTTLYKDGEVLARTRWSLEAQRTFFNLDSYYDTKIKCPKVEAQGGYRTTTRCYFPPDTYEQLSRSLIRTNINFFNSTSQELLVTKNTPYYKYGTRGSYAGILTEQFYFEETSDEKEFPRSYNTSWIPRDTRKYKAIWRVWDLDHINLPNGNYSNCNYRFGDVKIDLKDNCQELDYAEIKGDRIWFYFTPQRGQQFFDVSLVDPQIIKFNQIKILNKKQNHTKTWNISVDYYNIINNCIYNISNSSYKSCRRYNRTEYLYYSKLIIDAEYQELNINGILTNSSDLGLWCWDDKKNKIWCNSYIDGIAEYHKQEIILGMSYCYIDYISDNYSCTDFMKLVLEEKIRKWIIK